MTRLVSLRPFLACAALLLAATSPSRAQAPVIGGGECLYLVGAPAGAPAAATEQRVAESRILEVCTQPAQVDLNRDGENMIQAWIERDTILTFAERTCELRGRVGHLFQAASTLPGPTRAWISLRGSVVGSLESERSVYGDDTIDARLTLQVTENTAAGAVVVAVTPLSHSLATLTEVRLIQEDFGAAVSVDLRPGAFYSVELRLDLWARNTFILADFGRDDAERFVRYDSIEVCVAPATGDAAARQRSLERDLYERNCYPGVWLPEEQGGQLGEARDLVATRLVQAEASGARGVNAPAAQRSIDAADAAIADIDYQRACRSLVQGLHALSTP